MPISRIHNPIAFGTDGWRARLAEDFTFHNVRRIAWALGQIILKKEPKVHVFVGNDRRFMSEDFAREAASILAGMGVATKLGADILPTPAYSYLAKKHQCYALIVTASHNPAHDNGIKIKTPQGASAPQSFTQDIEKLTLDAPYNYNRARCLPDANMRQEYVAYLKALAKPLSRKMGNKKIVVDYFHGAGAGYLEEALGARNIITLRKERDPYFGGLAPEPVGKNLIELQRTVRRARAFLGVGLDGDGDRLSLIDEKGNYLAPTTVFAMYAYYHAVTLKEKGEIVQGVSLGYLGERIAQKAELPFHWVAVGFKNIAERMARHNVLIGGEESGGYSLGKLLPDRDGSVNTILMLRLLIDLGMAPSVFVKEIFKELGVSFYERFDLRLQNTINKSRFQQLCSEDLTAKLKKAGFEFVRELTLDGNKFFLEDGSWLLLRPSGTEPLVRIYAETASKTTTHKLIELASEWAIKAVKNGK